MASDSKVGAISAVLGFIALVLGVISSIYGGYKWYTSELYDLNGKWKFVFLIHDSSMKTYKGMSAGFKIFVQQDGKTAHGVGEKWWVNNVKVPYAQHDKIEFNGTIDNGVLNATYVLYGKIKTTAGGFKGKIKNDTQLLGDYSGTAADVTGTFVAVKE